jgi:hypothetical protein
VLALLGVASVAGCGSRSGLLGDGLASDGQASDDGEPEVAAVLPFTPLAPPTELPSPPEPELTGCVDRRFSYDTLPPTVLLLIDQSASMDFRFGASTRWEVLRSAIVDPNDGLLSHLDSSVSFGLMLYTSLDGYAGGECPMLTESSLEVGNAATIRSLYLASEPLDNGDTPTPEAIDAAVARLTALGAAGPRYILLLTDGDPDTCAVPDPQNGGGEALAAAGRAYAAGITLRPIGISTEISRWRIQGLANAAAGKEPRLVWGQDADAERPLFASDDRGELAAQLTGVIGDVRSCVVELGDIVGAVRAGEGRLSLDGQPLTYQGVNGWRFRDDDTVEIRGESCDTILGEGHQLEVFFPCVPGQLQPRPPR